VRIPRQIFLKHYFEKIGLHLRELREQFKEVPKQYGKSENDLKTLQGVGQYKWTGENV
uniref:Uncharacterized protein n=1 Tax=Sarcophilus harrisii TaxID=9305 RepID=A0A7N4UZ60_SARHA